MRIVTLDAGATEIVCALGMSDDLVGVDDGSDWPPDIADLPRVPLVAAGQRARFDERSLIGLAPDLVVAGGNRDLRASDGTKLAAVIEGLPGDAALLTLDPLSIEGVFNAIAAVGAMVEAEDEAMGLVEILRERLGSFEQVHANRRKSGRRPPRVVAVDGLRPLTAAGRWVPEQIRRAGGWDVLGPERDSSASTSWEAIRDLDPQIVLVLPRGLHLAEAEAAWASTLRPAWWAELDAVRRDQVFAVDGSSYFDRAGPRLVDGIGLLSEIFDPEAFVDMSPPMSWTPIYR